MDIETRTIFAWLAITYWSLSKRRPCCFFWCQLSREYINKKSSGSTTWPVQSLHLQPTVGLEQQQQQNRSIADRFSLDFLPTISRETIQFECTVRSNGRWGILGLVIGQLAIRRWGKCTDCQRWITKTEWFLTRDLLFTDAENRLRDKASWRPPVSRRFGSRGMASHSCTMRPTAGIHRKPVIQFQSYFPLNNY